MSKLSNLEFSQFMNGLNTNPIPLEFTQALSTSEFLHVLLGYCKEVAESAETLNDSIYKEFTKKFDALAKDLESKITDAKLLEAYMDKIHEYCTKYLSDMIADSLKYIVFELDDSGHFCAYIPDSWNTKISFDTNVNSESVDYGKLILQY